MIEWPIVRVNGCCESMLPPFNNPGSASVPQKCGSRRRRLPLAIASNPEWMSYVLSPRCETVLSRFTAVYTDYVTVDDAVCLSREAKSETLPGPMADWVVG